jgi:multidrug efflux pump subunit AcrA (membrane-fusion protein)
MPASKKRYFLLIPISVISLTGLITLWLVKNPPPVPQKKEIVERYPVQVTQLVRGNHQPNASIYGYVVSNKVSTLTAGLTTEIQSIHIKPGDAVKKGDTLITLNPKDINLIIAQQKQTIQSAKASIAVEKIEFIHQNTQLKQNKALYNLALTDMSRIAYLLRYQAATAAEYDAKKIKAIQAEQAYETTKTELKTHIFRLRKLMATLKQAKAQLAQRQLDAKKTTLKAPFDGWITQVSVAPGERTQIGQALLTLYDKNQLEIKATLPETLIPELEHAKQKGNHLHAQVTYAGITAHEPWTLSRLSANINTGQTTQEAYFSTKHTLLKLGAPVTINITLPTLHHVFRMPLAGLFGANTIYTLTDNNRLKSLKIDVLGRQTTEGSTYVLFKSKTLDEESFVLTQPLPKAKEGLKVRPLHT